MSPDADAPATVDQTVRAQGAHQDGQHAEHSTPTRGNIVMVPIADIIVGERFRKDLGNLRELADSIDTVGLLQPVGLNDAMRVVFGHRRIEAHKLLGRERIAARIINVSSPVRIEHDENEMRKAFTVSERVEIAKAIEAEMVERRGRGNVQNSAQLKGQKTREIVAKKAGFENHEALRVAKAVIEQAVPELVQAVDAGAVSVSAAAAVAKLPEAEQKEIVTAGAVKAKAAEMRARSAPPAKPVRVVTGDVSKTLKRVAKALQGASAVQHGKQIAQHRTQIHRLNEKKDLERIRDWCISALKAFVREESGIDDIDLEESEIDGLREMVSDLRASLTEADAELQIIRKATEADDALAAAVAENLRLQKQLQAQELHGKGQFNEIESHKRHIKDLYAQIKAADRKRDAALAEVARLKGGDEVRGDE